MKFGFLNIGSTHTVCTFANRLSAKGYYLSFAINYKDGDDTRKILDLAADCDVVLVAASKLKFAEAFNLPELDLKADYVVIDTLLYIFLDSIQSLQSIEDIIKDYYTKLNIRISPYRIFLEQGKVPDLGTIYDPKKLKLDDKFMLTYQKSGSFMDIVVRCRNDARIAKLNEFILENYFNYIYSTSFVALNELVAASLTKNNLRIKLAESFTGGRLAAELSSIPGASSYFDQSLVTYSEDAKKDILCVPSAVIDDYGAPSRETAYAMVKKLISKGCDIALATTGDAGPTVQRGGKVGKCFIAIAASGKIEVNEYEFSGSREEIVQSGVEHALFLLYRKLTIAYN